MSDWNAQIIEEFRSHEGKVAGYFEGATMLLLHTEGRRTGTEYVNPLVYLPDEGRWVVVASKSGAPFDPDWLKNLGRTPRRRSRSAPNGSPSGRPRSSARRQREALYARQVERRPGFADYLEKTKGIRSIPVVVPTSPILGSRGGPRSARRPPVARADTAPRGDRPAPRTSDRAAGSRTCARDASLSLELR